MMQSGQLEIFLALLPPNWQTCPVAKPGVKTSVGALKTITRSCLQHECWRGWILFFPEKSQRIEWKCRWGKIGESRTKQYGENLVIRETRVIFHSRNNQKNSKAKLLGIPCLYKKQNQLSKGKAKMTEQTARALTGYGAQCQYQLFSTPQEAATVFAESFSDQRGQPDGNSKEWKLQSTGRDKVCFLCMTGGWTERVFSLIQV